MLVLVTVVTPPDLADEAGEAAADSADEEEDDDDDDDDDEEEGEDEADEPVPAPPVDKGTGILVWKWDCVGAEMAVVVALRSRTPRSRKSRLFTAASLP